MTPIEKYNETLSLQRDILALLIAKASDELDSKCVAMSAMLAAVAILKSTGQEDELQEMFNIAKSGRLAGAGFQRGGAERPS